MQSGKYPTGGHAAAGGRAGWLRGLLPPIDVSSPFRDQLLARLADGEWHDAQELVQEEASPGTLAAFVRILRAAGYDIEQDGEPDRLRYRLRGFA